MTWRIHTQRLIIFFFFDLSNSSNYLYYFYHIQSYALATVLFLYIFYGCFPLMAFIMLIKCYILGSLLKMGLSKRTKLIVRFLGDFTGHFYQNQTTDGILRFH